MLRADLSGRRALVTEPADFAGIILFRYAGAAYVTGEIIRADGGAVA